MLSVILPVYNVESYLADCLDSLLAQGYPHLEIIAVDDGSTDSSFAILQSYEEKFQGKLRIFQKENGGLSDARNFGLERASGEYVAFLDSDDLLHPDFAEKTVAKLEKEKLDLVLCNYFYYSAPENSRLGNTVKGFCDSAKKEALLAAPMAWLRVFRKEILKDLRFRKGILYEDLLFSSELLFHTEAIGFLPEGLYYYRQRQGSIMKSATFHEKQLDIFTVLGEILSLYKEKGVLETYQAELEFLFIEHLFRSAALRFSHYHKERKELFEALRTTVKEAFPRWRENPYLRRCSLFFRLTVFFSSRGHFRAVAILSRLKG